MQLIEPTVIRLRAKRVGATSSWTLPLHFNPVSYQTTAAKSCLGGFRGFRTGRINYKVLRTQVLCGLAILQAAMHHARVSSVVLPMKLNTVPTVVFIALALVCYMLFVAPVFTLFAFDTALTEDQDPVASRPSPLSLLTSTGEAIDCKLYEEHNGRGAYDDVCVEDAVDHAWYQHKNLSVEIEAAHGGKPCESVQVKKLCRPVDCSYTATVTACAFNEAAGHWLKTTTRMISMEPRHGGSACPPAVESVSCDVEHYCDPLPHAADRAACKSAVETVRNWARLY